MTGEKLIDDSQDNKPNKVIKRVVTLAVGAIVVAGSYIGLESGSSATPVKSRPVASSTTKSSNKAVKKAEIPSTTSTTVTPTPIPRSQAYPSGAFLGSMEIVRKGSNETNSLDATVTHRLNDGMWTANNASVDPTEMLDYGFVYNQNTASFGTVGETTLVANHDVTRINAPVVQNGITYNAPWVTHSFDANPAAGIGNMDVGDEFIVALNNANNTQTVYTYDIVDRSVIDANNVAEIQALADPPTNPNVSQLRDYDCWTPGQDTEREVFTADLVGPPKVVPGVASFSGTETPINNGQL